jgi:GR25 family glycosyltransferase involved in LPS biosynthesis
MQSLLDDPFLEDHNWVIVCEDDAVLSPRFEKDIERVLSRCSTLDMVMLASVAAPADVRWQDPVTVHTAISPVASPIVSFTSRPLIRTVGYVQPEVMYGTLLYVIRRSGAHKLLSSIDRLPYFVADDWKEFARMGLRIGLVRPNMAGQRDGIPSEISEFSNGELWQSSVHDVKNLRKRIRIRTRLRRAARTFAVGVADLRGRG